MVGAPDWTRTSDTGIRNPLLLTDNGLIILRLLLVFVDFTRPCRPRKTRIFSGGNFKFELKWYPFWYPVSDHLTGTHVHPPSL